MSYYKYLKPLISPFFNLRNNKNSKQAVFYCWPRIKSGKNILKKVKFHSISLSSILVGTQCYGLLRPDSRSSASFLHIKCYLKKFGLGLFGLTSHHISTIGYWGQCGTNRKVRGRQFLVLRAVGQNWWLPSFQVCSYQPSQQRGVSQDEKSYINRARKLSLYVSYFYSIMLFFQQ